MACALAKLMTICSARVPTVQPLMMDYVMGAGRRRNFLSNCSRRVVSCVDFRSFSLSPKQISQSRAWPQERVIIRLAKSPLRVESGRSAGDQKMLSAYSSAFGVSALRALPRRNPRRGQQLAFRLQMWVCVQGCSHPRLQLQFAACAPSGSALR